MATMFVVLLVALACVSAATGAVPAETDHMTYLDNGQIRLGLDLNVGGAVTYLAEVKNPVNMINSWDWGRQVQMSFYSGPVPFKPAGATLASCWEGLGWNPIQAGDHFHHGSKVLEHTNDGQTIYVKCVPMIWPLDNVPAECTFECSYRLVGKTVEITGRLNNARPDQTQYTGRTQELPAVYTNGPWYKLVTYLGDQPFTGAATTTLVDKDDGKGWPWVNFYTPEHWAALVDHDDHGLGVFHAGAYRFGTGFHSAPKGAGGPKDSQTGYLSPTHDEILDHNIRYEYKYALIVGTLQEIRGYAQTHRPAAELPKWQFQVDRQHWVYAKTTDAGWPIRGELVVKLAQKESSELVSPMTFWQAAEGGKVRLEAAVDAGTTEIEVLAEPFTDQEKTARVAWGPGSEVPVKQWIGPVKVPVVGDGKYRLYEADLAAAPGYKGAMMRLKIRLPAGQGAVRVKAVEITKG